MAMLWPHVVDLCLVDVKPRCGVGCCAGDLSLKILNNNVAAMGLMGDLTAAPSSQL